MSLQVTDGWDDEEDLEIESTSENDGWKHDLEPSEVDDDQGGGEWSFDDEVILENDEGDKPSTVPPDTRMANSIPENINNGGEKGGDWSFDDEILEDNKQVEKPSTAPVFHTLASESTAKNSRQINSDVAVKMTMDAKASAAEQPVADEWSFDDDSFLEDREPTPKPDATSLKEEATFQSLMRYMETLPVLLPSLNALLEAEYNTYHHAVELTEYYQSRPQLYDYTLDTELPRMDYEVVLPNQTRLTDKYQVQQYLLSKRSKDNNILIRSANQSLLADLLGQLTGPDRIVQHQFLATAMATKCRFVIHPSFVECHCHLNLSLPSSTGDRLDVARLELSIDFGQPPSVAYRLHKVEMILQDMRRLRETAAFLSSLEDDSFVEEYQPTSDDLVRDAFMAKLSQTQQFMEDSHAGLSKAWKQIDSVANVSRKIDFLKKGLTNLPTVEATEEAEAVPPNLQPPSRRHPPPLPPQQAKKQMAPPPPVAPHQSVDNRTLVPTPPPTRPTPPNSAGQRPPPLPSGGAQDRPAPLLGGLLRSGWNRLAQSVTLPDEEIPMATMPAVAKLYRPENEANRDAARAPSLHVKNRQSPPFQPTPVPPSKVPNTTAKKQDVVMMPPSPEKDEQDGWDDDDLALDDDDLSVETPNRPQSPPQRPPPPTAPDAPPPQEPFVKGPSISPSPMDSVFSHADYNPEDDIIPTRKRWVNPRPGNRQLRV